MKSYNANTERPRIQTLDGLRFLAAMGVLWIHSWTAHGNPRLWFGIFDLSSILAIGGNGVDLFFVISGFCMYYFYGAKGKFSYYDFYRFIIKRWVRLSPAFYVATIIYLLVEKFPNNYNVDTVYGFLHSVFYLNFIFGQYNSAHHFWTLTVEWQFYFIIPFLLIYQNIMGFKNTFFIIFGSLFFIAFVSVLMLKINSDIWTSTILFRSIQFGCGIIAAKLLIKDTMFFKYRALWLLVFIIVTYTGRVLISQSALSLMPHYYNLFKLLGFTLMGCGFAGILYLSVTSTKWLKLFLGNKLFKKVGRISYSFYLLHALIFNAVANYTIKYMPFSKGIMAPLITTCISAFILYPIALISFNYLEKPFFSIGNLTTR